MKNGSVPRVWSILLCLVNSTVFVESFLFGKQPKYVFYTELKDPKPLGLAQESFWPKVAY